MQSTFKWRDKVVVLVGKLRGQELIVSSIHKSGIWLVKASKRDGFSPAIGPYTPDQLEKAE